jgi:hypothetical protein
MIVTIHAACTSVIHDHVDCEAAALPVSHWCPSCRVNLATTVPVERVGPSAIVDLHRFEDDGGSAEPLQAYEDRAHA